MRFVREALFAGVVAAWAAGASWLLREAKSILAHVPGAVGELLRDGPTRDALAGIVRQIAGYGNLTNVERRDKALHTVTIWLENHGVHLTDQELNLLVELLYAWVKKRFPEQVRPEPSPFGPADTPAAR